MGYLNTTLIKKAAGDVEIVDDIPTNNMRNVSSRVRPAGTPVTPTPAPTTTAMVPYQAPATTAIAPYQAPTPAPANKPINYARRTWNSARSLGRNAMGMGRQGWQATKTFANRAIHNPVQTGKQSWQLAKALAKRNPKLAALLAIGGSLTGGAMLGSAASSGRPPVQQHDVNNPYAGFTTTY